MLLTLTQLRDKDGLVSLEHVIVNPAQPRDLHLKITGQQVFLSPHALAVADYVIPRPDIAGLTKIMLQENQSMIKRMPIYGVTFEKALEKAMMAKPGHILKSMFKADLPEGASDHGFCATLVTHIQRASSYIQIEAWQLIENDTETFYLHGLIDPITKNFYHFDGATMHHDTQAAEALFTYGNKIKGVNYQKWFRLDGYMRNSDIVSIAKAHFPLESLLVEYFECHEESQA